MFNKSTYIALGILVIIIILGVWGYLFIYGKPKNVGEIFAHFGLSGKQDTVAPTETPTVDVSDTSTEGKRQPLKQLTTRPVAGARFVDDSIEYAEQGTGHIYTINLQSGAETILNGTTVPGTYEAHFNDTGYVALTLIERSLPKTVIEQVTQDASSTKAFGVSLPLGVRNISFSYATDTIVYTMYTNGKTTAYGYNLKKAVSTPLFTTPLRDIRVLWGDHAFIYTTPTASLEGYVYKIVKNEPTYIARGGRALTTFLFQNNPIITRKENGDIYSYLTTSSEEVYIPIKVIPEKCATDSVYLYCGVPNNLDDIERFPDDWYKGVVSYSDSLWKVDVAKGVAENISNFVEESGRDIDVQTMGSNPDGSKLYFINKNDNTLWLFDLSL